MTFIIDPASVLGSEHTLHASRHVDSLGTTNEPMRKDGNEFLASQVQAFLEASENVGIDTETIEDILKALVVNKEDAEDAENHHSDTQMNEDEDSDGEFEASTQELDISPLFERNQEGFLSFHFPCYYFLLIYVYQ